MGCGDSGSDKRSVVAIDCATATCDIRGSGEKRGTETGTGLATDDTLRGNLVFSPSASVTGWSWIRIRVRGGADIEV